MNKKRKENYPRITPHRGTTNSCRTRAPSRQPPRRVLQNAWSPDFNWWPWKGFCSVCTVGSAASSLAAGRRGQL